MGIAPRRVGYPCSRTSKDMGHYDLLIPLGTLLLIGGLMVGLLGQDRGSASTRRLAHSVGYFSIAAGMLIIGVGAVLITTQF